MNLKNWLVHLTKIDNNIVDRIFRFINHVNICVFLFVTGLFYFWGIIINHRHPFPQFIFFQFLFSVIFLIAFFSVRYFEKQMKEIHRLTAGDKSLQPINDKIYRIRRSALNLIIPPLAGLYFGVLALILVNVNIKLMSALYLILTYGICVLVSFLGYLQYVYLFIYIKSLSHNTKTVTIYNKDFPANTKWVVLLAKLYSNYRNLFFVLGASYVFGVIYFVLCEKYMVLEKILSNKLYQIPLILFWGSVFIAIVVFFPISSIVEYSKIKAIIDNLKNQSIIDLNRKIPEYSEKHEVKMQKSFLIIAITNTPDYPFKDKLGIAFSAFITCVNLAASIVAILEYTIA